MYSEKVSFGIRYATVFSESLNFLRNISIIYFELHRDANKKVDQCVVKILSARMFHEVRLFYHV